MHVCGSELQVCKYIYEQVYRFDIQCFKCLSKFQECHFRLQVCKCEMIVYT